ncbi:MAG: hypothetical protein R2942_16190 [Ignavibacteria bacterium]
MSRKIALVTGGARRLGKDICLELGRSGFDVIFTYNKSSKEVVNNALSESGKPARMQLHINAILQK